jgi:hypothetical protein
MKFTYSSGQRPLEGYTIKRGIGRGGFGEVYYGLSDGGKEVALKLVRNNLEVEMRGMSQCLNFKHPNLVNLYDLRTDAQGDQWVIMEYVSGEPLSTILNRHPQGLPPELAQQWFMGLSAAVSYLHDHGIVHRDLKPGNIFLENGAVKVGDYGLCKFISGSQGSAQTQSVGTVHYMAPEISTGNYNKQIDIYGAGIILYEMLSGHVPFEGESAGEILMKHLTSPPDLSKLPADYVPILNKALAKNPAHRYRTMAEMAKEVAAVGAAIPTVLPVRAPAPPRPVKEEPVPEVIPVVLPVPTLRAQVVELCGSLAGSALLAALFTVLLAALFYTNGVTEANATALTEVGGCFFLTVASCWSVLIPSKLWTSRLEESWKRRICLMALGFLIGVGALWLDGRRFEDLVATDTATAENSSGRWAHDLPVAACYLSYFGVAFFALRWWKMADRRRHERFSFFAVLAAGFWAYVLLFLWPRPEHPLGAVALVLAAVIIQLVSPWEQPPPPKTRKLRLHYA